MGSSDFKITDLLNVASGRDSLKVSIGIDTQSAVLLFFALFLSIVLAGIIIKKVN